MAEAPRWVDRLERRFGAWSIPQLSSFIAGMNAAVWLLSMLGQSTVERDFRALLLLDPAAVRAGELWRLVTFLFIPPNMSPLWMFFWISLLFTYARALEARWGEFHFNVFYGLGWIATLLTSLGLGVGISNVGLNTSIFLAFAALYPNFEILLFFVLPVKVKWLAWLAWAGLAWAFAFSDWIGRAALASGIANYLAFFGADAVAGLRLRLTTWRNRRRYRDAFK